METSREKADREYNETSCHGASLIIGLIIGAILGWAFTPTTSVEYRDREVEVVKIEYLPATNEDVYNFCASHARSALYSNWDGKPREGTTPRNTQDFIDDCFTKLTDK